MPLTPEQLALRKTKITATDATAIAGVNPWRTALDVYVDKVADTPPSPSSRAARVGDRAEGLIMDLLAEERGLVLAPATTEVHPILPWAAATPDRNVLDAPEGRRVALAEAKCVGFRQASKWGDSGEVDDVPEYVLVQVQWQMLCTRQRLAYVAALLGTDLRVYEVEHNEDLAAAVLEACDGFRRHHLEARVPPPPGGGVAGEALSRLFPRSRGGMVAATSVEEQIAVRYFAARRSREAAEHEEEAAKAELMAAIGERDGIEGDGWRATWRSTASGGVDWEALATALSPEPAFVEQFKRPGVRRFLCAPSKETR
jgi:putative phage-type endonuclease